MARLPVHPRPVSQANTQKTRAIDHNRTAQRNRSSRARTNGTRAAPANPQASGDAPMGPTENRSSDAHDAVSDAGTGTPKTVSAPRPAHTTPITQGRQMRAATTVAPTARVTERWVDRQSRPKHEEATRARAHTTVTMAMAGAKEMRTASMRPSATAAWSVWCRPIHPAA